MKTIIGATIGALLAIVPTDGQAQVARQSDCALRISSASTNWFVQGYDPFGTNPPVATFDVTFFNDGGAACVFDPVFQLDQEAFGLTREGKTGRATYTLLDQFSGTSVTPLSGRTIERATRRPVVIEPQRQQLVRYQFTVDENGLTGDGLYSQYVTLSAERRGTGDILATQSLRLGVNVLPSAVLGLSGQFTLAGGLALVDLGELQEGTAPVSLRVRVSSTRAYRLEFVSKNSGRLVLGDSQWDVPYSIRVGEKSLSLKGKATYESNDTDAIAQSLPLLFMVGDVSGRRAGTYSDMLTVSIAPR